MPGDEFKVGDMVVLTLAGVVRTARVIEDRGRIGVGGRRLLRIELIDPDLGDDVPRFEVPAEQVQAAA
jgi:hypothetical protein